jgi:hypothetical protein
VLPKLFRVEDRGLERTAADRPSAAEMADFQEGVATEAYEACLTSARFGQGLISPKLWFPITKPS